MAEKAKLTQEEFEWLVYRWGWSEPITLINWDLQRLAMRLGQKPAKSPGVAAALTRQLQEKGLLGEDGRTLTPTGKAAVLNFYGEEPVSVEAELLRVKSQPQRHLVWFPALAVFADGILWVPEGVEFLHGEVLAFQWAFEPWEVMEEPPELKAPDVPADPTEFRWMREKLGEKLEVVVQLLDDDQATAKPVRVLLKDLWLEAELTLDFEEAETILAYCLRPVLVSEERDEREQAALLWLERRQFIRFSTTNGDCYEITAKGKLALAAAKRRQEG